jgi:phenylacetate-CoA ligase
MIGLEDWGYTWLGRYTDAPQWIKSSLGTLYGCLPMRVRYGTRFECYLAEARMTDAGQVKALAAQRLRETLGWAAVTVPAYRHIESRLHEDASPETWLAQFPLTGKADIRANPESYLSRASAPIERIAMFTSGSHTEPFAFYLQRGISRCKETAYLQAFGERVHAGGASMSLRGPSIQGSTAYGGPASSWEPINRMLWVSPNHLTASHMPSHIQAALRRGVSSVQGYSSAVYRVACWLRDNPNPRFTNEIRAVQLVSEDVEPYMIDEIRRVFDCPVVALYGHSERAVAAGTMPDDARYFVWPQYGHLELVDEQGQPITAPDVPGEIVATGFDNRVMPFVRYRTGDTAVWSSTAEHPSLPGYPVLERIDGRANDYVLARDGRQIAVTLLCGLRLPEFSLLDAIQYEQFEPGKLIVRIEASRELPPWVRETVHRFFNAKMHGLVEAELQRVSRIERTARGKRKMLIQHIPQAVRGSMSAGSH